MDLITEPGVYDIPEDAYHADPVEGGSLSSTGARQLLPPSCPAKFRWNQDHPDANRTEEMDFGRAAHRLVLGAGADIARIDASSWRTKDAQKDAAEARAAGLTPLLAAKADIAEEMAAALRAHPTASALFAPGSGRPEQTLVWHDHRTGIARRALIDWLPYDTGGRMILADYKTAASAEQTEIERAIEKWGYHLQADWYLDGVHELGLAKTTAFLLVVQEKTPPYVITIAQIHPEDLLIGHVKNEYAIEVYRRCVETGRWPGYSDEPVLARIPHWAQTQFDRARERGDFNLPEVSRAR